MVRPRDDRSGTQFFWMALLLALFYSAYRYPFQISSSGTSPGYSDTPLALQAGKYALFVVFALWRTTQLARIGFRRLSITRSGIFLCICASYLAVHPIILLLNNPDPGRLIDGLFWLAMPLLLIAPTDTEGAPRSLKIDSLTKLFSFFFYVNVVFFVVEVLLLLFFQRLPALSFDDSILVRFGGIWDDPNGHCTFLSFFLPFVIYARTSSWRKFFDLSALTVMVLGTQSVTGVIASLTGFFFSTTLLLFVESNRAAYRRVLMAPLLLLCIFLAMVFTLEPFRTIVNDSFSTYLELKSGSVDGHAKSLELLATTEWLQLLGFEAADAWGESGYANWIVNYGLIYVMIFMSMALVMLFRTVTMIRRHRSNDFRILLCSIFCFQLTYIIGMVNLPLDTVFPANLLFVLLSALPFRSFAPPLNSSLVVAR